MSLYTWDILLFIYLVMLVIVQKDQTDSAQIDMKMLMPFRW